ncbi:MAG: response regulator [Treponema sp.]|jgi:PAS domain S-box-containing protein|nr:response regulator [Treponema sp.]
MENLNKNSVLVVDDENANLDVLDDILRPEYTIYTTKNGFSAIEMAGKYLPDVILLDIILPDINGFHVISKLKASDKTKHIPVIIITALDTTEDEEKSLDLGAADFIYKPFSAKVIKSRVRNQMQIINQIRVSKQYAHDMQHTLARLEAVVNNFKGIIWSTDKTGVITSFNGQYLSSIGLKSENIVGKKIEDARIINKHLDIMEYVNDTFSEGPQDWISEIDGRHFRTQTTLIRDDAGNVLGVVGSTEDITELTELQQKLEAAVISAQAANQAKSVFLAKMSHEIRTPLNAVLCISEIHHQSKNLPQDIREAFTRIYNSGDLLMGIINDILDISKIEAGKLELIQSCYDVPGMINESVVLNSIKYRNKPIRLIINIDENVPAQLYGDDLRIKQILNNLLSNSFKYTASGEVELSFNAEVNRDSVTLVIRVRDTGQGMTQEQIGMLFDEYARFNSELNKTTEGTGLGMAITYNLLNLMNGKIEVESSPGRGTLVTLRIPQGSAGAAAIGKETAEKLKQVRLNLDIKEEKPQIKYEQMPFGNVLVVDDAEMNLYVVKGILSFYGLQVDTAASGLEAIDLVKQNEYDILFMDHMMPGMDGIETVKNIRKWEEEQRKTGGEKNAGKPVPIIALTANAVSGMREVFLSNGFDGFLSKPIVAQELDDIIKKFMPSDKFLRTENEDSRPQAAEKTEIDFMDEIRKIDEINSEAGLGQLSGMKDIYRNALSMYVNKVLFECEKMTALLNAKDIHNFKISVHAMKSMLAVIGAYELSEVAYILEMASLNEDTGYCTLIFPELKEKLLSLYEKLCAVFGKAEKDVKHCGKILVVDDAVMILYLVKEKLLNYGLDADIAENGPEAIEKVKKLHAENGGYDIIFMDFMLPDMDGIKTAAGIREWEKQNNKKSSVIIAFTEKEESRDKEMFLNNGFDGFMSKPVLNDELEDILREWLPSALESVSGK